MTTLIKLLNLIMAGLVTGIIVGIWLGYNPMTFSFSTFVEQHQGAVKALNTLMPLMGLITIILTLISAFRQKNNKPVFVTLLIAAILLVISGLVTKLGNQPINAIVMTWNTTDVPGNWNELRDKWWSFHLMRTALSFIAFCLIVWTTVRKD